jgi:hypothetical protein
MQAHTERELLLTWSVKLNFSSGGNCFEIINISLATCFALVKAISVL